jgi:hypothetical protein
MSFTAQQERPAAQSPQPQAEIQEASPHEIKYRHDTSHYVAAMLTELRQIAGKAGFERLVTALDAAYYEAYAAMDNHSRQAAQVDSEKVSSGMEQTGMEPR